MMHFLMSKAPMYAAPNDLEIRHMPSSCLRDGSV
eukprot:CAMPEP_0180143078 /NCGR_PEP_ID=MMETSP0986-20121125/16026_1 /TAXON_ID=697907 /ORGANISM="non described non described, Strain CCMP2293" /LENGTH=33 /DNA_ID= /DNA_START= /DNA_END= /DNA_ORIENTATION=